MIVNEKIIKKKKDVMHNKAIPLHSIIIHTYLQKASHLVLNRRGTVEKLCGFIGIEQNVPTRCF